MADAWPSVSIVVLNRDGVDLLRRLLAGLCKQTDYASLELIVVDNASSDNSLDFLRSLQAPFPISLVANAHNESFSDACNQGAELASGELLLFLNNDAEPFEPGWLRELVACLVESGAGAVGPTLFEPAENGDGSRGYVVHQRGLRLRYENGLVAPGYRDRHADPLGAGLGVDVEPLALIAACLLITPESFDRIGRFTPGYWYGPEDFDLALKLREQGLPLVCSGRSLLIHPPNSTLGRIDTQDRNAWVRGNRRLFMERWGPRLRREYELDRLEGGGFWAGPVPESDPPEGFTRDELEALAFCLRSAALDNHSTASESPVAISDALRRDGHRCRALGDGTENDLAALDYDVAVHLRGTPRHMPKPAQLNILWALDRPESLSAIESGRYDLVVSRDEAPLRRLGDEGLAAEKLASLDGVDTPALAASLAAAAKARAEQIGLRTRIGHEPLLSAR